MSASRKRTGRTDAKLRYARVHLEELRMKRLLARVVDGDDWEKAHQESFLFHLFGVRDAFLQEINSSHNAGLSMRNVTKHALIEKLESMGVSSAALSALVKLEKDDKSWLSIAGRFRHRFTHQDDVARQYVIDGANGDPVFLKDPQTGRLIETDFVRLFGEWLEKMQAFVKETRDKLPGAENG